MSTAQVQDFCKACVLTGEATQDECDVSMMRRPARDTRARRRPAAPSPAAPASAESRARPRTKIVAAARRIFDVRRQFILADRDRDRDKTRAARAEPESKLLLFLASLRRVSLVKGA